VDSSYKSTHHNVFIHTDQGGEYSKFHSSSQNCPTDGGAPPLDMGSAGIPRRIILHRHSWMRFCASVVSRVSFGDHPRSPTADALGQMRGKKFVLSTNSLHMQASTPPTKLLSHDLEHVKSVGSTL